MNFGKVSGNGIGVGLSQRMFEPFCSRSCLVTAQFVLPRVGGEGSRCNSSLLVPGPRGAGNLRFSQLTPGGAISFWEKACLNPLNSILVSGTLGRERTSVGRKARRTVRRVCCLQKGCPSVSHSPVLCTGEAAPWGQLQEPLSSSASAEGSQALPSGNPFPTIIDLSPLLFFSSFSLLLTSHLVPTLCFSLHLSVLFIYFYPRRRGQGTLMALGVTRELRSIGLPVLSSCEKPMPPQRRFSLFDSVSFTLFYSSAFTFSVHPCSRVSESLQSLYAHTFNYLTPTRFEAQSKGSMMKKKIVPPFPLLPLIVHPPSLLPTILWYVQSFCTSSSTSPLATSSGSIKKHTIVVGNQGCSPSVCRHIHAFPGFSTGPGPEC